MHEHNPPLFYSSSIISTFHVLTVLIISLHVPPFVPNNFLKPSFSSPFSPNRPSALSPAHTTLPLCVSICLNTGEPHLNVTVFRYHQVGSKIKQISPKDLLSSKTLRTANIQKAVRKGLRGPSSTQATGKSMVPWVPP